MKKLILLLFLLPCIAFGQTTLIPDTVFEQALINLGYDTGNPDGSVPTNNISGVPFLSVYGKNISDLTGIEDFTALTYLWCFDNQLTSLDVSQNTALTYLNCHSNQLTSLNVSNNTALIELLCDTNQLTCLNVKNGNNINMTNFIASGNPNLTCMEVDDAAWSTANWTYIDSIASFSDGCNNFCSSCLTTYGDDTQTGCNTYTWIDGNTYNSSNNTATHTLTNMAGCDSIVTLNLTINNSTTSTDTNTACDNYTWIDSNTYTTSNSSATHTLTNAAGCDSVVTLNLTINTVNGIINNSPTLTAAAAGATYQWLDCNNNFTPITGEVNQSYTATASGNYAVEVTKNNCTDTSDCESVTVVGLQENKVSNIHIHPNPTNDQITINIKGYHGPVEVEVYDLSGRLLLTTKFTTLSIKNYAKGIYVFKVSYGDRVEEIKVVKD